MLVKAFLNKDQVSCFLYQFHHSVHDDISGKHKVSPTSFRLYEVICVRPCSMGGWCWYRTIASAVLAKLSVLLGSTCLRLLSPPTHCLSLSNTHPRGQLSVGVILHILCGKGQRGALRLTSSLPREKVSSTKTQKKQQHPGCYFTQRAVRSILSACLQRLFNSLMFIHY